VLCWTAAVDRTSALLMAVTLPVIPVFMAPIGRSAGGRARASFEALAGLSGWFLDVVRGLPSLRAFNRGSAQLAGIREVTDRYRRTTMGTLRLSFLSGVVLDLAATLSTAVVAATERILDALGPSVDNPEHPDWRSATLPSGGRAPAGRVPACPAGGGGAGRASGGHRPLPGAAAVGAGPGRPGPPARRAGGRGRSQRSRQHHPWPGAARAHPARRGVRGRRRPAPDRGRPRLVAGPGGLASQHPALVPGTVAANLALGRPGADLAAIEEAARQAGADRFIGRLRTATTP
jgi:hypothetical protein